MEPYAQTTAAAPRVLVVKLSSLGDLFHALPAVHCLKAGWQATIEWAVHPAYRELVECFTEVSRVLPIERRATPRALIRSARALWARPYDLVLDLQGILKSAVAARAARAARRIGPSFHREGSCCLYHAVAGPRRRDRHAVEEILDTVRFLGLPVLEPAFPVAFPAEPVTAPHPRVALLPFSRWPSKNWPIAHATRVARDLRRQTGASIFLVGGPDDRAASAALAAGIGEGVVNLAGVLSLPRLGGLLQAMDLAIAADTGPMHMAACVGTPVLALFGPTDPRRTGPYGTRHRVLQAGLSCQPCFDRRCRRGAPSCLASIRPETVAELARQMLQDAAAGRAPAGKDATA